MATALMAIARKVIILDYSKITPDYIWATGGVVIAMSYRLFHAAEWTFAVCVITPSRSNMTASYDLLEIPGIDLSELIEPPCRPAPSPLIHIAGMVISDGADSPHQFLHGGNVGLLCILTYLGCNVCIGQASVHEVLYPCL